MTLASTSPAPPADGWKSAREDSVGFKDWAVICDALGEGTQSLILRKGGIAEGRDGFRFKHETFFLFPTGYHQQFDKVRPAGPERVAMPVATGAETVEIRSLFVLEFAHWIEDWARLVRLEPFHIWNEAAVRERFEYGSERGLQCAFGRVYRSARPWTFPNRPSYGGCRSWVSLPPAPDDLAFAPVLGEQDHALRKQEVLGVLCPA